MRHVAVGFVVLLMAAALPVTAQSVTSNECTGTTRCHTISTPAGAPESAASTYYLYLAAAECAPQFHSRCAGRSPDSAESAPLNLVGILWEESNGVGGLQRFEEYFLGIRKAPDTMVLV